MEGFTTKTPRSRSSSDEEQRGHGKKQQFLFFLISVEPQLAFPFSRQRER